MNKSCKIECKTGPRFQAKAWSGRRESNPRMQLGKISAVPRILRMLQLVLDR